MTGEFDYYNWLFKEYGTATPTWWYPPVFPITYDRCPYCGGQIEYEQPVDSTADEVDEELKFYNGNTIHYNGDYVTRTEIGEPIDPKAWEDWVNQSVHVIDCLDEVVYPGERAYPGECDHIDTTETCDDCGLVLKVCHHGPHPSYFGHMPQLADPREDMIALAESAGSPGLTKVQIDGMIEVFTDE